MNIRPYVSVDVESTGLHTEQGHHLLSVGMVFDDGLPNTKIDQMPKLHLAVECKEILGTPYAIAMNSKLIGVISGYDKEEIEGLTVRTGNVVCDEVIDFMNKATDFAHQWDDENGERLESIQILAKNGQKLDIPMLDKLFKDYGRDPSFSSMISHRVMDLGSMYVSKYGRNVSLSLINKDLGREAVTHNGLEDAIDNVVEFRSLLGLSYYDIPF